MNVSLEFFLPDIIVYNAGTDILEGDSLGHLSISPKVTCLWSARNFILLRYIIEIRGIIFNIQHCVILQ